jgi:DNA-binding CsgD family transcriptional regulator
VAYSVRDRAQADLAKLAGARLDSDGFRWEAAAILRRAIGVDGWYWLLVDPGAGLPTRQLGENAIVGQSIRHFYLRHPELTALPWELSAGPVSVTSAVTGGDLARDLAWRETFGPAAMGDQIRAPLIADGLCWAQLHLHRDSDSGSFTADDAGFVAEVAPLLATRLRDGLHNRLSEVDAALGGDSAEPGTFILDEDLSVVASTPAAWSWIDRLGLVKPGDVEPLPASLYAVATRVALSRARGAEPPVGAHVRMQAADGQWTVVRAAPLMGAAGGYVITLEAARSQDLAPLLMRALSFTTREREVARLLIDGRSSEDIARTLFISVHTVRDHVKAILAKAGVSRRHDLIAVLAGHTPSRQGDDT